LNKSSTKNILQVEASKEYDECRKEAIKSIESKFGELEHAKVCQGMKNYFGCSRSAVLKMCNQDAWKLVAKVGIFHEYLMMLFILICMLQNNFLISRLQSKV